MKFGISADIRRGGMYGSSTDYSIVKVLNKFSTFSGKITMGWAKNLLTFKAEKRVRLYVKKIPSTFKGKKTRGWKP